MSALDETVWTEVVELASKGRFGIPLAARKRIEWWGGDLADGLFATLELGGVALLEPWAPRGVDTLKQVREALRNADPVRRSELSLAAMDRYMRVACEDNGRLVLPSNLLAHIDPTGLGKARVIVMDGILRLRSEVHWQADRNLRLGLLVDIA